MATTEKDVHLPASEREKSGRNISDAERLISTVGGGALAAYGASSKGWKGAALTALGGALVARGVSGHCPVNAATGRNTAVRPDFALKIESAYTVNAEPADVYAYWRKLDNLPRFMRHLESVTDLGDGKSHWVAAGPAGMKAEWDAEIINDVPNEILAWTSVPGSQIENAGAVHFRTAPGGRGTELRVTLEYNPPYGKPGAIIAKLFGQEPHVQVDEDLRRFKQLLEAGEIPTVDGQPNGKSPGKQESLGHSLLHSSR